MHQISIDDVVKAVLLDRSAIKRLVEPKDVAELVDWLGSGAGGMATGASWVMDGGWSAQ